MNVGLVLGAGGYAGEGFHAGVLSALAEATGWDPRDATVMVGTSAGSGVASWLRAGLSPADLVALALEAPLSPEGIALFGADARAVHHASAAAPRSYRPSSPRLLAQILRSPRLLSIPRIGTALLPDGRRSTDFIVEEVRRVSGDAWPDEPMWLCAVDLDTGRRVVFGRPTAPAATRGQAIAASCAVPAFFSPVEIGGRRYVDGGVHSPTNADLLLGEDLDLVIVSSPMSAVRGAGRSSLDAAARAVCRRILAREVRALRREGAPVLTFQPTEDVLFATDVQGMDPACRREVAERAREAAIGMLARPRFAAVADLLARAGRAA